MRQEPTRPDLNLLATQIEQWAHDRGLLQGRETVEALKSQALKMFEEAGEIAQAINKRQGQMVLMDAVGDTLVTLVLLSRLGGFTLNEAAELAYNEIKDRKGKTTADGVFIREVN